MSFPREKSKRSFKRRVLAVVSKIPKGKILTYKEVAMRAGNVLAARAVGSILSKNYNPDIPCHRVINSDGSLGGYNRGIKNKLVILRKEGFL
ncbi:MAG TPA: MGMT family protein [Candidatus Pacearchaeota archaeon]|nr:MGMT family protein [Candidatus Pacearchaeota archaeon]